MSIDDIDEYNRKSGAFRVAAERYVDRANDYVCSSAAWNLMRHGNDAERVRRLDLLSARAHFREMVRDFEQLVRVALGESPAEPLPRRSDLPALIQLREQCWVDARRIVGLATVRVYHSEPGDAIDVLMKAMDNAKSCTRVMMREPTEQTETELTAQEVIALIREATR